MTFNLATLIKEAGARTPVAPFLRSGSSVTTYADADERSDRFAAGLAQQGIEAGSVVAIQLPNVPEFAEALFGALKAGMTVLPLNPLLKASELEYHLRDCGARVLIGYAPFADQARPAAQAAGTDLFVLNDPGTPVPEGLNDFTALMPTAEHAQRPSPLTATNADDTALLIYTSGTTGRPKGAELTHFQMYMAATVVGETFGERSEDVVLGVLPLFHVFGLSALLRCARFGSSIALMPRFDADEVLATIERHRVTEVLGVPTMLHALAAADTTGRDLSSIRVAGSGGASIPGEVMRAFEAKYGVPILEGYGLSETSSICSFNGSAEERRPLSVGKPVWGVDMAVMGADGTLLPPGRENVGEIVTRGFNVMKGYLGRPEATAEVLRDGWLRTGDLGYVDDEGFYFIVDRQKDLIIRGGYNVYPRELEEVLHDHHAILEAAVIGRPDDRLGEEVVAMIVVRDGHDVTGEDIVAYCRKHMAAYKYPREVHFLPALPKGPTGKVLKTKLRTHLAPAVQGESQ